MKRCVTDETGRPIAFYATEIHGDKIPGGAFEISEADWTECISNAGRRAFVDGELVEVDPPEGRSDGADPAKRKGIFGWR